MSGHEHPEEPGHSITRKVVVTHAPGLHLRPCDAIAKAVQRFRSRVKISYGDQETDAGDILNLLSLAVPQGAEVTLWAEGPDADEAMNTLVELFSEDFGFND